MSDEANRYDHIYKAAIVVFALFICVVLLITTANIVAINRRTAVQQERTNQYLRCTALTPVDKRTPDFVDQCFKK